MKAFGKFIRTTIAGGILFMIPVIVVISFAKKALNILKRLTEPWDARMKSEIMWGLDGHNLVGGLMLIVLCFLAGLVFQVATIKRYVTMVEVKLLSRFPGYRLIKALASEAVGDSNGQGQAPVLVKEGDRYRPGFLTEQHGDLCTVFLPEAPQVNTGELQILPATSVVHLPITTHSMKHMIRSLGKGISKLMAENPDQPNGSKAKF
jgi:uncharacterized membrane protein